MKYLLVLGIVLSLFACKNPDPTGFTIDVSVDVESDYSGYLYLITTKKLDSSLVIDGKSSFSGKVESPIEAGIITDTISGFNRTFYLENAEIQMNIKLTEKDFGNGPSDWIIVENVEGTETAGIRRDFEEYQSDNAGKEDWNRKLYTKLEELISEYPDHRYPGDLLAGFSADSTLSRDQVEELYQKLDKEIQNPYSIKELEKNLYPETTLESGDQLLDISGYNAAGEKISTEDYRGKTLLLDFWASWCKPCIDQFPELEGLNEEFEDQGLVVLGVSLDEDENKWRNTIEKHSLIWPNIFSGQDLAGEIAKEYGIYAIPFNVLIDEKGEILKKNVSEEELRGYFGLAE